jgi:pimeloyl-ACP methyl ester carboxylesterase
MNGSASAMNNMHLWRSDYVVNNGFRQFYREWRPVDASHLPVLALHGSLTQSGMWILPAETAASIHMLCPDQRDFGRSEDPGGDSCAEFAADAVTLARNLLPTRYVIMGHSFACSIALEVARLAPAVAAAILVDPVMPAGMRPNAVPSSAPESFASLAEAERYFRDTEEGQWTDETLARFVQDIMIQDGQRWRFPYSAQRLQRLRAFTASGSSDYDLFSKAKATRCPVLLFRGGMSKRFPAAAEQAFLAAFAAKAKLVVCPKSGHFPTATEAMLVAAEMRRFLDSIAPR